MKKGIVLLVVSVLSAMALAGCHTQEHSREQGAGDLSNDADIDGPRDEVTSIQIIESPEQAAPGEDFQVCWDIEGRGNAELTALYFDNESHPDEAFGEFGADVLEHYRLGFVFPNNTDAVHPDGYPLPQAYCAFLPMTEETLYMRAYVVLDVPPGQLSPEEAVEVTSEIAVTPDPDE